MILEVKNITKDFAVERGVFQREQGFVKALDNVSFSLDEFQALGIAGESGSGKTTLAKIILKLIAATSGQIIFNEEKIKNFRKDVQIIFQNPYNSLNPKMRIISIISEPLLIHRIISSENVKDRALELVKMVGLDEGALNRYPIEFSGGQRQRICIARALAAEPKFLVLDEPISSLDLTIQAQMLDLFMELKEKLKLTYIFISHNLAVIKHIANSVIIMQNGRIVEQDRVDNIFGHPRQSYTKLLLEAARA
jgi:peptide/nickel transport system ATP-binding protein/oligopeptide transport system ATP-binding protein